MKKCWVVVVYKETAKEFYIRDGLIGSPSLPGYQTPVSDFVYMQEPKGAWKSYVLKDTPGMKWHIVEVEYE